MSTVRISWEGDLTKEQSEILNDMFNIMGMQHAAEAGHIPQEDVDREQARLDEKYKDIDPEKVWAEE